MVLQILSLEVLYLFLQVSDVLSWVNELFTHGVYGVGRVTGGLKVAHLDSWTSELTNVAWEDVLIGCYELLQEFNSLSQIFRLFIKLVCLNVLLSDLLVLVIILISKVLVYFE